jgi:hypothetical protein
MNLVERSRLNVAEILAHTHVPAMLTNAGAPAILAHTPSPPAMLANAAAPAILAHTLLSAAMLTTFARFWLRCHGRRLQRC